MATKNRYQQIVPFIIFVLALILVFFLVRPMITVLLSSVLLAFVSFPIYTRVIKKIPNKTISIILSLFIVFVVVMIPISFLVYEVTKQGYYFYGSLSNSIEKGALFGFGCTSTESQICSLVNKAERFSIDRSSTFGFDEQLQKLLPIIEAKITKFILSIPLMFAEIFFTLIIAFFILQNWEVILQKVANLLPMRVSTKNQLIDEFGNITYTVVYAQLFVVAVQGLVGAVGFYIFGVPFPIILGILMAFCALIPAMGTIIIWVPASAFLILSGYFSNDYWVLGKGIGLFVYGALIISMIDDFLLAKIVHAKANVCQIIVIIGVIGGVGLFGIPGIFIGPILLPLLITYFQTFKERFV